MPLTTPCSSQKLFTAGLGQSVSGQSVAIWNISSTAHTTAKKVAVPGVSFCLRARSASHQTVTAARISTRTRAAVLTASAPAPR